MIYFVLLLAMIHIRNFVKKRNEYYRNKRLEDITKTRIEEKVYMRQYNSSPKRIYQILIHNAKKRKYCIDFLLEEFIDWWERIPNVCFYCNSTLPEIYKDNSDTRHISRLTIDRLDNKIGYNIENIVKCCWLCNRIKSNDFTMDEMLRIGQVIHILKAK